jgi:hypothetical protein
MSAHSRIAATQTNPLEEPEKDFITKPFDISLMTSAHSVAMSVLYR